MAVAGFQDLLVWQKAMDLVVACYRVTQAFPATERYALSSQLQRAAVSVPANIAEGQGREHTREFIHHLAFARGSLCEVQTHLLIAGRLGYANDETVRDLCAAGQEIGRMISGLIRALERKLSVP